MIRFLSAGESHGWGISSIIEGMPAGMPLSENDIDKDLKRRMAGYGRSERMKIESDTAQIVSGLYKGKTTGSPLAILIRNVDSRDLSDPDAHPFLIPRPGHADLAGSLKYNHTDMRAVSERTSARETAGRVAVGAVMKRLLSYFNIEFIGFVVDIGGMKVKTGREKISDIREAVEISTIRCPDIRAEEKIRSLIEETSAEGDSLGGIFTVVIEGVPPGLGSFAHWDRKLDARLAAALMSIPAVKGVEIGEGFHQAGMPGSKVHDEIYWQEGFKRKTNRAGGLEGGVSNGEPIILRAVMKPIPTIKKPLNSVNIATKEAAKSQYQRADVCAVPAASVIGEAVCAWAIAEAFLEKFCPDTLSDLKDSYSHYMKRIKEF